MIEPPATHVKLILPARAKYLKVLRSILASVAVGLDFSVERIEDLKMAVAESCSQLLAAGGTNGEPLTIVADRKPTGLHLQVSLAGITSVWPPADIESSLTWMVLTTVASDVFFGSSDNRAYVELFVGREGSEVAGKPESGH